MKIHFALLAGSLLFASAADAKAPRVFRVGPSIGYLASLPSVAPLASTPAPAPAPAPACEPLASVALAAGASTLSLAPWNGRGCAAPYGVADTGSHRLQTVTVAARTAVAITTDAGLVELVGEGNRTVLLTTDGLCAAGVRTGVAIVEPGTYVLRATNAGEGVRDVRVEAMAVPARAVLSTDAWVPMSTAASEGDLRCGGDGADVRVLACPNARRATLSAPNGLVASVEGIGSARACFSVAPGQAQTVALPSGSLTIVRAWAYGAERGAVSVDLR
ncbi:MAG: hypothetical protein U0324_13275 [Polyangiales bacterium]